MEANPAFSKYITSFTNGDFIPSDAHFVVRLRNSVSDTIKPGQNIVKKIFSFEPAISGKTQWVDNQTIEFIPDKLLKSNTIYKVKIKIGQLIEMPSELQVMEYEIKTIQQSFRLSEGIIVTYPDEMRFLRYENEIITADRINSTQLEKTAKAEFDGKTLKIKWNHDANGRIHNFYIDSIPRKKSSEKMSILVDGASIDVSHKVNKEQRIPGIDEFEIMSVTPHLGENQYITIRFSDPLLRNQNIDGLVYFTSGEELSLAVSGNTIIATPSQPILGMKSLIISKSIKNAVSNKMKTSMKYELNFESVKPAVRLIGQGTIMPSSDGLIFPFEAINLSAVDIRIIQIYENNILYFLQDNRLEDNNNMSRVGRLIAQKKINLNIEKADPNKWTTYKIDLSKLINLQPGAIYRVEVRFRQEYSLYTCNQESNLSISDDDYAQEVKEAMAKYDGNNYYYEWDYEWDYEDYNWQDRENPCKSSYYTSERYVAKNILVSNIGIIAKGTPTGKYVVAVSNIITAKPIENAKVVFYNFQRQKLTSGNTDANGFYTGSFKEIPFSCVVEFEGQKGYLRMSNYDALPMSNFNVGGVVMQDGMKGFIYGERGVWRPGDELFLTFILEDKFNQFPDNYPVKFSLYNPSNQLIETYVDKGGVNGFYHFHTRTADDALTGDWLLKVQAGGAVFSRNIKIETIKPNRIRAKIAFNKDIITRDDLNNTFKIAAQWLHGSPAADLNYDIKLKLKAMKTTFAKFDQYNFDDLLSKYNPEEIDLASGVLDDEGADDLSIDFGQEEVPGFLTAVLTTRVFEKSGDFSIMTQSVNYSHFDFYVGGKMLSQGENGWYDIKKTHKLGVVLVDKNGRAKAGKKVKISIFKVDWRWWWESHDDLANYISSSSSREVFSNTVITGADGKSAISFKLPHANWQDNGRFLIVLTDEDGQHRSSFTTYFSEWYGSVGGVGEAATILAINSNKEKYEVNEEAEIIIPSSAGGEAIVTLEKGSEIVDAFRVSTLANETRFKIKIKPEMAPGIYVHISMIQPHAQSINDNPIRMYGVIPIDVINPETKLKPIIKMSAALEPEKEFTIEIKEEKGKAMTYTLAIVDEGLLDITGFSTPDPWSRFYAREALQVRTWDLYDQIIGAYGAKLDKAFAIGGGDKILDPSKSKTQRFKPIVIFSGPHILNKGAKKIHKFKMPNYIGSVKVMVVAGQDGAYGNAEKSVPVKKDLMILSTLPRVLGPEEFVNIPITVFAMNNNVKTVNITLRSNLLIIPQGARNQTINFKQTGEKIVYFPVKIASITGKAWIKIEAVSGNLKAINTIEIDVRNPNPPQTITIEKMLKPGEIWKESVKAFGIKGTNSASVEVASMIPINLNNRLNYLIRYPHGCLEQTISAVFPQLYLDKITELSPKQKADIQLHITEALSKFRNFQLPNGAFSYWPGQEVANNWATNYVGHFIIEAQAKGYVLPSGMLKSWISYQTQTANNWTRYDYYGADLDQAYRLFLLAKIQKPATSAMNRLREYEKISTRASIMLAGAYSLINQKTAAVKLIANPASYHYQSDDYYDYTYGSDIRDKAFTILILKQMGRYSEAFELVKEVAKELDSDNWYSTQTTSISLMALADFFSTNSKEKMNINLGLDSKDEAIETNKAMISRAIKVDDMGNHTVVVKNISKKACFVKIQITGTPAGKSEIAVSKNLDMAVSYHDMAGKTIDPSKIKQGTDFKAIVSIYNTGFYDYYRDLALTQIFPSGWEIINDRLFDIGGSGSYPADYRDIRDDRISSYFQLPRSQSASFTVMLNAAYIGKFYLPAVRCESMYDNKIEAVVPGQWVEVIKR